MSQDSTETVTAKKAATRKRNLIKLRRTLRHRSAELRTEEEKEWAIVRETIQGAVDARHNHLLLDELAWSYWTRHRGDLPFGWHRTWPLVCVESLEGFAGELEPPTGFGVSLARFRMALGQDGRDLGDKDLGILREHLYALAGTVFSSSPVGENGESKL